LESNDLLRLRQADKLFESTTPWSGIFWHI
jgi:hypothetical protein